MNSVAFQPAARPYPVPGGGARIVRRHSAAERRRAVQAHPAGRRAPESAKRRGGQSFALQFFPPLGLFLTLVFQLWIRVGILEASYELETVRQRAVNRDAEVRKLRSDLAVATSPRLLSGRAKAELGMILSPAKNVRKIGEK